MTMTTNDFEQVAADAPTLMVPLRVEFASDHRGHAQFWERLPWQELVTHLSKPKRIGEQPLAEYRRLTAAGVSGDKEALYAREVVTVQHWRPVIPEVNPARLQGRADHVLLSAMVFDVEGGMPVKEVLGRLAGHCAVVHSTYSHCPEDPRWRVVLPLRMRINGETWRHLLEHFQEVFGGRLGDIDRFDPEHWFRLPACPRDAIEHFTCMKVDGEVIDGVALATAALVGRAKRGARPLSADVSPSVPSVPSSAPVVKMPLRVEKLGTAPSPSTRVDSVADASDSHEAAESAEAPCETGVGDLRQQFAEVVDGFKKDGDYERVRDKLLDLSIQLNEAGAWAPAFRPYPKIPKVRAKHETWHSTLQRDLQVIDCHWLHSRRFPVFPRDPEFLELFDCEKPFDMDLAETFAAKVWKTQHRVDEALGLTTFQQAQLCALRGTGIIQRRQDMFNGSGSGASRVQPTQGRFRRAMGVWCEKNPRMRSQQAAYQALWEARELLGVGASMSQISQLAAWKLGDGRSPLADKTVRDKLGNLDERLAGTP